MTEEAGKHCLFCKKSEQDLKVLLAFPPTLPALPDAWYMCDECLTCLVDIFARVNETWRDEQIEALIKIRDESVKNSN
jgi:hypothetical protein